MMYMTPELDPMFSANVTQGWRESTLLNRLAKLFHVVVLSVLSGNGS